MFLHLINQCINERFCSTVSIKAIQNVYSYDNKEVYQQVKWVLQHTESQLHLPDRVFIVEPLLSIQEAASLSQSWPLLGCTDVRRNCLHRNCSRTSLLHRSTRSRVSEYRLGIFYIHWLMIVYTIRCRHHFNT